MTAGPKRGGRQVTRQIRVASIVALAFVLVGCGSAAVATTAPSASAVTTPEPVSPSPIIVVAASPSASANTGWKTLVLKNPALRLDVPVTWQEWPLTAVEEQLKQELPSLSGDLAKAWRYGIEQIENGQSRWILAGPSTVAQYTATIELTVLTNSDSLAAGVVRQKKVDATLFPATATRTEVNLVLPIGPAVRETMVFDPIGGAPTGDVDYFLRLDGSTLMLAGSAPSNDSTFLDLMGRLAQSLRRG